MKSFFLLWFATTSLYVFSQNASISIVAKSPGYDTLKLALLRNELLEDITFLPVVLDKGRGLVKLTVDGVKNFAITQDGTYYYIKGVVAPGTHLQIEYDGNDIKNTVTYPGKAGLATRIFNTLRAANNPDSLTFTKEILSNKALLGKDQVHFLLSVLEGKLFRRGYLEKGLQPALTSFSCFPHLKYSFSAISNIYNTLNEFAAQPGSTGNLRHKYTLLDSVLPQDIRNQVLCLFLTEDIKSRHTDSIQDIIKLITDPTMRQFLQKKLYNSYAISEGVPAPDFSLENAAGQYISLQSLKGKVVYLDFWFAGCLPCEILYKKTLPVRKRYEKDSLVVFLNISIDDKQLWLSTLKERNLTGTNVFTQNQGREHPVIKNYNVQGYPATFLINKSGRISVINPPEEEQLLIKQIENLKQ